MYKLNSWTKKDSFKSSKIANNYFRSVSTACGGEINTACGTETTTTACGSEINTACGSELFN